MSSFAETPNDAKSYLLFFLFVDSSGLIERSLPFPCNLPKSEGPCTKSLHRYYFDATEDSETLKGYILYIYTRFALIIFLDFALICNLKILFIFPTNCFHLFLTQCARTDLNKRFLPKPMTTTG